MKRFEKVFKALANRKRLEILAFLEKEKRAAVGEIAEEINTSLKAASKHLFILYHSEFLERERERGLTFYSISDTLNGVEKNLINILRRHF